MISMASKKKGILLRIFFLASWLIAGHYRDTLPDSIPQQYPLHCEKKLVEKAENFRTKLGMESAFFGNLFAHSAMDYIHG